MEQKIRENNAMVIVTPLPRPPLQDPSFLDTPTSGAMENPWPTRHAASPRRTERPLAKREVQDLVF